MNNPLVSVMTPSYNVEHTLPRAVNSLLLQSYTNWECIIVDDGSTDRTSEVASMIAEKDARFKLISFPENKGRPYARQAALDAARGKYLCMLDADDWYYPEKILTQIDYLERNPEIGLVSTLMILVDSNNVPVGIRGNTSHNAEIISIPKLRRVPNGLPVPHAPSCIRMDVAKRCFYDTRLKRSQDSDFIFQVWSMTRLAIINRPLYVYTGYFNNRTTGLVNSYKYSRLIYMKYIRHYPVMASLKILSTYVKALIVRFASAISLLNTLSSVDLHRIGRIDDSSYQKLLLQLETTDTFSS